MHGVVATVDNGTLPKVYSLLVMRISRYIGGSLIEVFLASCAVLYAVMVIVEWVRIGAFISFRELDILLLAMVPMSIFVLPMALIFSVLIVLERLSSDSEIIAMKACGVSMRTIASPILVLSLACMIINLIMSTFAGPVSMQRIQDRLLEAAPKKMYAFLTERKFDNTFKDLVFYVESVDHAERVLNTVFLETTGTEKTIITAEKGFLDLGQSGIMMRLINGSMYMEKGASRRWLTFDEYVFSLEANLARELRIRTYDTATQPQLRIMISEDPRPRMIKEYHNRFAFPVLNIILALIGITFGIQKPRTQKFTGFIAGLGTIMGYYLVFVFADRLVKGGVLDPVLGAWLPNMAFGIVLLLVVVWRRSPLGKARI
ncbi:MAG TPA: YjgP/YjgQ family permease [Deltaproteobacteria bacterium]|nr:YjgP/YjgQ family permease [Deltaproteobacteria bacterium]